jgi:hypothetical protein
MLKLTTTKKYSPEDIAAILKAPESVQKRVLRAVGGTVKSNVARPFNIIAKVLQDYGSHKL